MPKKARKVYLVFLTSSMGLGRSPVAAFSNRPDAEAYTANAEREGDLCTISPIEVKPEGWRPDGFIAPPLGYMQGRKGF